MNVKEPKNRRISFFDQASDVLAALRGLWLLLFLNILSVFIFLFIDQGTDVLLSIAEDVAGSFRVAPFVWLLIALLFWSIASEFGARMLIYLSDNSGKSLSLDRVQYRKSVQCILSRIFLFLPVALMMLGFLKAWVVNGPDLDSPNIRVAFVCILVALLLFTILLYVLYNGNGIVDLARKYSWLTWIAISPRENQWVTKLYGILNDVRVDLPLSETEYTGFDLPRNTILPNGTKLLNEFIAYRGNPEEDQESELKVWMFKIPLSFYRCLIRQLAVLFFISVLFIVAFSLFAQPTTYMYFGTTALICLAFGCWQVVYVALHFLDKAQHVFPIRFTLLVLFLITTFFNQDHPIRTLQSAQAIKPALTDHFNTWFARLQKDTAMASTQKIYRLSRNKDTIPVVFVAAEGGALRTGAFTAMILAKLTDRYPSFSKYIYCYSGVSGGSLGTNFYNALYIDRLTHPQKLSYSQATDTFFKTDFLAASIGKMVFGEIINYFIPWHIPRLDRAIALEQAWEEGYRRTEPGENEFKSSFTRTYGPMFPANFINTTEAESGLQCIWSNVNAQRLPLGKQRDLTVRTGKDISYSTAINLSTRFPLISPGAAILYGKERKHFVDGGYFENTGAETLLQVLGQLDLKTKPIKPYVLQFNFADDDTTIKSTSIRSFSEIMEIIGGIYNTRSGRSNMAQFYLQHYVDSLKGEFISLNLPITTRKFPLNWILSNTAVHRLDTTIQVFVQPSSAETLDTTDKNQLHRLFVYQK